MRKPAGRQDTASYNFESDSLLKPLPPAQLRGQLGSPTFTWGGCYHSSPGVWGRWNERDPRWMPLAQNKGPIRAGRPCTVFLSHAHSGLCDHTYRVVDGFREEGRAVGETGQHELNQHEGDVDVESDVAKHVDLGVLHARGRGGGHLRGAACRGRGEQDAGPGARIPTLAHLPPHRKITGGRQTRHGVVPAPGEDVPRGVRGPGPGRGASPRSRPGPARTGRGTRSTDLTALCASDQCFSTGGGFTFQGTLAASGGNSVCHNLGGCSWRPASRG